MEDDVKEVLTVHISVGKTGAFYATCDQHKGVVTVERTLSAALASVVPALQDLLAAGAAHPDPAAFDGIEIV